MKATLPCSATGEEFREGSFAEDLRTFVSGEGEDDGTGIGAVGRLFTPGMIYCSLEGRKDMGRLVI